MTCLPALLQGIIICGLMGKERRVIADVISYVWLPALLILWGVIAYFISINHRAQVVFAFCACALALILFLLLISIVGRDLFNAFLMGM